MHPFPGSSVKTRIKKQKRNTCGIQETGYIMKEQQNNCKK